MNVGCVIQIGNKSAQGNSVLAGICKMIKRICWTNKQNEQLKQLVANGKSAKKIGLELNRSKNSVIGHCYRMRIQLHGGIDKLNGGGRPIGTTGPRLVSVKPVKPVTSDLPQMTKRPVEFRKSVTLPKPKPVIVEQKVIDDDVKTSRFIIHPVFDPDTLTWFVSTPREAEAKTIRQLLEKMPKGTTCANYYPHGNLQTSADRNRHW